MKQPYKLIVFDWEGTLGDPLGHVHSALSQEAKALSLGAYDMLSARKYVSLGLDKAVKKIFPGFQLPQYERLLLGVQQALMLSHTDVYLFEGAKQCIEKLHKAGVLLAIATNKGQQSLARTLDVLALKPFFAMTRAAGEAPPKPSPDMLADILETLGVLPEETLVIGDSPSDIDMARALNVAALGVDFYHQHTDALKQAGAVDVLYDFKQIETYLGL